MIKMAPTSQLSEIELQQLGVLAFIRPEYSMSDSYAGGSGPQAAGPQGEELSMVGIVYELLRIINL